jgi:DNA-binding CsgD family transcriptional regulator
MTKFFELGLTETKCTEECIQGEIVSVTLSQREREVVLLAVEGLTTEEMARSLQISPSTIKAHLLKIYRKLGIKRRVQLVKFVNAL